eukprot:TRINITY_DN613_c0_g2_i1.p1 TRINITY_DN613_c0_g2~~TRINITY_DN613_c0_g2_i1.p1  ORF type:complete len:870 (+),score=251.41 TRINITY_DN613_c0_g2_i1:330-2939(+)
MLKAAAVLAKIARPKAELSSRTWSLQDAADIASRLVSLKRSARPVSLVDLNNLVINRRQLPSEINAAIDAQVKELESNPQSSASSTESTEDPKSSGTGKSPMDLAGTLLEEMVAQKYPQEDVMLPDTFLPKLTSWQKELFNFMKAREASEDTKGGIVFHDDQLGKFLTSLAVIAAEKQQNPTVGPTLIVCPNNGVKQIETDIATFTKLKSKVWDLKLHRKNFMEEYANFDIWIVTFDNLYLSWQTKPYLYQKKWHRVVVRGAVDHGKGPSRRLDEEDQNIEEINEAAKGSSKFAIDVRQENKIVRLRQDWAALSNLSATNRWLLTSITDKSEELLNSAAPMLTFLRVSKFSKTRWNKEISNKLFTKKIDWKTNLPIPRPLALQMQGMEELKKVMLPVSIIRTNQQIYLENPEHLREILLQKHDFDMKDEESKLYDKAAEKLRASGTDKYGLMTPLEASLRMCQVIRHPYVWLLAEHSRSEEVSCNVLNGDFEKLIEPSTPHTSLPQSKPGNNRLRPKLLDTEALRMSSRLEEIEKVIQQIPRNEKCIISDRSVVFLNIISTRLNALGIQHAMISGANQTANDAAAEKFNGPDCQVLLYSSCKSTSYHFRDAIHHIRSHWWNPRQEEDFLRHVNLPGQNNPIVVHELLTKDTVDESIRNRHQERSINNAAWSLDGIKTAQEMHELKKVPWDTIYGVLYPRSQIAEMRSEAQEAARAEAAEAKEAKEAEHARKKEALEKKKLAAAEKKKQATEKKKSFTEKKKLAAEKKKEKKEKKAAKKAMKSAKKGKKAKKEAKKAESKLEAAEKRFLSEDEAEEKGLESLASLARTVAHLSTIVFQSTKELSLLRKQLNALQRGENPQHVQRDDKENE